MRLFAYNYDGVARGRSSRLSTLGNVAASHGHHDLDSRVDNNEKAARFPAVTAKLMIGWSELLVPTFWLVRGHTGALTDCMQAAHAPQWGLTPFQVLHQKLLPACLKAIIFIRST